MNIVLAVDGSEVSLDAVKHFIGLSKHFSGPHALHLLYVHPLIPIPMAAGHVPESALKAYYQEEGQTVLADSARLLHDAGLAFTPHIHAGPVAETIVKVADAVRADVICMGAHGRGRVLSAVMGSVAAQVVRMSPAPVVFPRAA